MSGNKQNKIQDNIIIKIAELNFKSIKLFPQGIYEDNYPHYADETYYKELGITHEVIKGGLEALSSELKKGSHYFGTRLHGGIFAMQHGNPTTIVDVDTRASSIFMGSGYEVLFRDSLTMDTLIDKSFRKPVLNNDVINNSLNGIISAFTRFNKN